MNWDHIESKWAAMTRRVRADLPGAPNIDAAAPRSAAPFTTRPAPDSRIDVRATDTDALRAE